MSGQNPFLFLYEHSLQYSRKPLGVQKCFAMKEEGYWPDCKHCLLQL